MPFYLLRGVCADAGGLNGVQPAGHDGYLPVYCRYRHDSALYSLRARPFLSYGGGAIWSELIVLRDSLLRRAERCLLLLLLVSAIAGLGRGGINYVPWNTYTYIADVDEVITGQRREGILPAL